MLKQGQEYYVNHGNAKSSVTIDRLESKECLEHLQQIDDKSYNVVFGSPQFDLDDKVKPFKEDSDLQFRKYLEWSYRWLDQCIRVLRDDGSLLIHNIPKWLPYYAIYLESKTMTFKYWIAFENVNIAVNRPLHPVHEGILFFVKDKERFLINTVREPHLGCRLCGDHLRDWGGKKDQMHPEGYAISDIWIDVRNNTNSRVPSHVIERIIRLSCKDGYRVLFAPYEQEIPVSRVINKC